MCFDIGIVTCGPNEALVVSGMGYGEINEDTKEYRPYVVMGDVITIIHNKRLNGCIFLICSSTSILSFFQTVLIVQSKDILLSEKRSKNFQNQEEGE